MTDSDDTGFEPDRTRAWVSSASRGVPDFDNPAFDRMTDVVLSAMTAVGGPGHVIERIAVLEKCLAMTVAGIMRGQPEREIRDACAEIGSILAGQVLAFQSAIGRDMVRKDRR